VAVAVRDRYLAPERISAHSLQQALNLANADVSRFRLDRAAVIARVDAPLPLSDATQRVLAAYDGVGEWRRALVEGGAVGDVSLGLLAADRVIDLIERLPAGDRAAVRARIAADERARTAAAGARLVPRDRVTGRERSM
jgi:hypothetical protein